VGERVNGEREQNERCEPPNNSKMGLYIFLGNQEPHGLPQEAHVTTSLN
jgi:hypothetical protein